MVLAEGGAAGTARVEIRLPRCSAGKAAAAFELIDTDGYVIVALESRGTIDVPANSRYATAYAGVGALLGSQVTVDLRGSYFTEDRGNGTPFQTNATVIGQGSGSARGNLLDGVWMARGSVASQDYEQTFSTVLTGRAPAG